VCGEAVLLCVCVCYRQVGRGDGVVLSVFIYCDGQGFLCAGRGMLCVILGVLGWGW